MKKTVIVVGAGIGGLAVAAQLAQKGCKVTIFEKNEHPGGRCDRKIKEGHHFDTGPTLFLMPELFTKTFDILGEKIEDHLDLRRVDPSYHIHFQDNTTLRLTSDLPSMRTQLESIEPGSFSGYLNYLLEGHQHYHLSMKHLVNRNFCNPADFYTFKNFELVFRLKAFKRHFKNLSAYFSDQRLKMAFSFQDMYVGLNPYQAPAIFSLLQYTEMAEGVWFPMGGMYKIVEALDEIARRSGVKIIFNNPVERICVNQSSATGVTLSSGQSYSADIIVSNADLPFVYCDLIPETGDSRKLSRKQFTCSTITFFWGVDKQYPQLKTHNLFFGRGYRQSFTRIYDEHTLPDDPSIYIHTPTRIDPSLAPMGQDSLTVVVPVGHINSDFPQDWDALTEQARNYVFQRLDQIGISDIDKHIKFEFCYAPPDWRNRYNLMYGSTHGLSHDILQMGYFRPHNRHSRYRNLYFVGASTHPGTGLPTVLVSSRLAAERISLEVL